MIQQQEATQKSKTLSANDLMGNDSIAPYPIYCELRQMVEELDQKLRQDKFTEASELATRLLIESRLLDVAIRSNTPDTSSA
jgi:hypothetical protein